MKLVKMAIIGSRDFLDYDYMVETIDRILEENDWYISEIVSGGARGADTLAERLAKANDIPVKVFPADWDTYGKRAGFLRNHQIIEYSEVVVAFQINKSKGTQHSIDIAREMNKTVFVIECKPKTYGRNTKNT